MQLAIALLISSSALILATDATPVNYFAPGANAFATTRYNDRTCEQHLGPCEQGPQMQQAPLFFASENTQTPVLKQVFTTITRKHDNLNTAEAKRKKNISIKYQTGPSVEVDGEFTKSASAKQSESDTPFDSGYIPSTQELTGIQMEPEQNRQLGTPAEDYQSIETTGGPTQNQPILMENPQVDEQLQPEQIQDEQSHNEEAPVETEPEEPLEDQLDEQSPPEQEQDEQIPSEEDEAEIDPTPEESLDNQPEEQSPPDQGLDEQNPIDEGGAVTDPTTITPDEVSLSCRPLKINNLPPHFPLHWEV
ncbi:hypothetical protein K7432_017990 [Basidiobolus ranarum]|uniref:Uncharacterized protein n=1 Tax=Basidiobolus ranarum TaxID=34480 RepID=A0ABR2VKQ3_9FUNG